MTFETYVREILRCNFAGFKDEIIETAVKRITEFKAESEDVIPRRYVLDLLENPKCMRKEIIYSIYKYPLEKE